MATPDAEVSAHPEERRPETLAEALVALTSHLATREQVDERFDALEARFDGMNRRIVAVAGGVALLVAVAAGLARMTSNILLSL